jgi:hypothetical protein
MRMNASAAVVIGYELKGRDSLSIKAEILLFAVATRGSFPPQVKPLHHEASNLMPTLRSQSSIPLYEFMTRCLIKHVEKLPYHTSLSGGAYSKYKFPSLQELEILRHKFYTIQYGPICFETSERIFRLEYFVTAKAA